MLIVQQIPVIDMYILLEMVHIKHKINYNLNIKEKKHLI